MTPIPFQLFIYLSQQINMQNPLLLMTEEDIVPTLFCNGMYFPIMCSQYSVVDINDATDLILSQAIKFSPIFLSCGEHKDLIKTLTRHPLLFSWNNVWVMPIEYATMMYLRLDNHVLFYDGIGGEEGKINVFESYSIKGMHPLNTRLLQWQEGNVSEASDFNMQMRILEGRSNLRGTALRVSPLNIKADGDKTEILQALQYKLNFSMQTIDSKEKRWGSRYKNGTWNGFVGMLNEAKIDLVGGLMLNKERHEVVDFCWPTAKMKITLLSSKYAIPKLNVWAYVDIFPLNAWIVGLCTLVVAALCFSISSHESIVQGLTLMWRLLLQIGYYLPTKGIASRLLMLTAAISLSTVFIYYETDLTATMTAEPKKLNIRDYPYI